MPILNVTYTRGAKEARNILIVRIINLILEKHPNATSKLTTMNANLTNFLKSLKENHAKSKVYLKPLERKFGIKTQRISGANSNMLAKLSTFPEAKSSSRDQRYFLLSAPREA